MLELLEFRCLVFAVALVVVFFEQVWEVVELVGCIVGTELFSVVVCVFFTSSSLYGKLLSGDEIGYLPGKNVLSIGFRLSIVGLGWEFCKTLMLIGSLLSTTAFIPFSLDFNGCGGCFREDACF
jgi:hypothetical protein